MAKKVFKINIEKLLSECIYLPDYKKQENKKAAITMKEVNDNLTKELCELLKQIETI